MKELIMFFLLFFSFSAKPQSSVITEIVQVPDKTAGQLYTSFKKWIALSVVDYEAAMLLDLPEEKNIIFKTNKGFQFLVKKVNVPGQYNIRVSCEFRDQRYKYKIDIESIQTGDQIFDYNYFLTLSDYNINRQYQISQGVTSILLKDKLINESIESILTVQKIVETSIAEVIESFKKYVAQPESTDW